MSKVKFLQTPLLKERRSLCQGRPFVSPCHLALVSIGCSPAPWLPFQAGWYQWVSPASAAITALVTYSKVTEESYFPASLPLNLKPFSPLPFPGEILLTLLWLAWTFMFWDPLAHSLPWFHPFHSVPIHISCKPYRCMFTISELRCLTPLSFLNWMCMWRGSCFKVTTLSPFLD